MHALVVVSGIFKLVISLGGQKCRLSVAKGLE